MCNEKTFFAKASAALSYATQHAMSQKFCNKWGTECLDTSFQTVPNSYDNNFLSQLLIFLIIELNRYVM